VSDVTEMEGIFTEVTARRDAHWISMKRYHLSRPRRAGIQSRWPADIGHDGGTHGMLLGRQIDRRLMERVKSGQRHCTQKAPNTYHVTRYGAI